MSERVRVPDINEVEKPVDAVIIGGGMGGPATAFFAEQYTGSDAQVVILEAHPGLGQGASTASLEQGRCGWPDPAVSDMMVASRDVLRNPQQYGLQITHDQLGFTERPYIWAAASDTEVDTYKRLATALSARGIPAEYLTDSDLYDICPWLQGTSVVGGMFDPTGYKVDSAAMSQAFARSSQKTDYFVDTAAQTVVVRGGQVIGVQTSRGFIPTEQVVIAAGSGTRGLVESADVSVPVISIPRFSYTSEGRHSSIRSEDPFVIVPRTYAYFRPEGGGVMGGYSHDASHVLKPDAMWPENTSDFRYQYLIALWQGLNRQGMVDPDMADDDTLDLLASAMSNNGPFSRGHVQGAYYVHREGALHDDRPIIARVPGVIGLSVITAQQGHGVMNAPATGMYGAELFFGDPRDDGYDQFGIHPPASEGISLTI